MVKAQRAGAAGPVSRRTSDIIGLLLFFLGAAFLLGLVFRQTAPIPAAVADGLRELAGAGAFAIPLILLFIGTMFLVGYQRLTVSHSSYGCILLFLAFITWRHVTGIPELGKANPFLEDAFVKEHGGYLGAALGTLLYSLTGQIWSYLFLVMVGCIAVVLMVERPFIEVLHLVFGKPAQAGLSAAKTGVAAVKDKRDARAEKVATKALAGGSSGREEIPAVVGGKVKGFLSFRREGGDDADDGPGAAMVPAVAAPVPPASKTPGARKKLSEPGDQVAFPTLASETAGDGAFQLPPLSLLKEAPTPPKKSQQELTEKIRVIEQTLEHFNISANVVEVAHGPTVTRYEIQLAPGIKVGKIVSLADNLAMALAAIDVRVEAPIPGKSAIGVEVPNATPAVVGLRDCVDTPEFWNAPSKITFCLGKDVAGQHKYADLAKMPHLLVAGSTNSGKSVCLNTLIASIVFRATPAEVKLLMIDPKRVELSLWDGIPHLMHPVVKDVKQAAGIFRAAIKEMERRYDLFARMQTRNIDGYNQRVPQDERIPYVVLVVDELADLMMQAGAEIETSICRLAQLARATGIHLVIATQRPSVDVITGLIKANISSRIAFAVSSSVDSRTILDMNGAERLIGRGDMLFMPIDAAKPVRIQGCYLSETETNTLVEYLRQQQTPEYSIALVESGGRGGAEMADDGEDGDDVDDELFEKAVRLVVTNGQASTSMLQRRFKIGYTRAARIVDVMEDRGIVGPPDGAKPREVLMSRDDADQLFRTGRYGIPEDLL